MINQQNIFDENLINIRKKRIINKFSSFLHSLAINDLKERLVEIGDEFLETLVVGPFAKHWAHNICQKNTSTTDDKEFLKIIPSSKDFIVSALHLHSVNDPISKLVQMRFGLKKTGIFMGYAFGEKSLYELRKSLEYAELKNFGGISPRVHPMIDTPTYGSLLSRSGFKFCVTDKLHFEIEYKDPWDLIIDLKSIGETNCLIKRSKRPLTKIFLNDVLNFYKNNFSSSKIHNKYIATFDIICLTGWNTKPKSVV
tara:strand:- start:167 stop:928 length:762 start_codon:yes stop_codon:yes gene_type:complete